MALADAFLQILIFETKQAEQAEKSLRKTTDDMIADMRNASRSAADAAGNAGRGLLALPAPASDAAAKLNALAVAGENSRHAGQAAGSSALTLTHHVSGLSDHIARLTPAWAEETKAHGALRGKLKSLGDGYRHSAQSVAVLVQNALSAIDAFSLLSSVISDSVSRAAEIEEMDKLGKKIHVATADVDAFAGSMAELGGSRSAAQSDLAAMAAAFGYADDSMAQILQTADDVQGMSFGEAKTTLAGFGVTDDKTVELMMKGREELSRMMDVQKTYSGITAQSIEQSARFNKTMQDFQLASGGLKNSFMDAIMPLLTTGLEWGNKLVSFCTENKSLVTGFFIAIGGVLGSVYIPLMLSSAAATLAATWPILAIGVAFALIYDDIMNFIDGNDSMIGRIFDKYPALKTAVFAVWDAFKVLFDYIGGAAGFIADIVVGAYSLMSESLSAFIGWLKGGISSVLAWGAGFTGIFDSVSDAVVGIFTWMWQQISRFLGWISKGLDMIKSGWATVKGWFGGEEEEVNQTVNRSVNTSGKIEYAIPPSPPLSDEDSVKLAGMMTQHLGKLATEPMAAMTSQAISNQTNSSSETRVSVGDIHIKTPATDAQGIAAGAVEALRLHLQDFGQQMTPGMAK